MHYVRDKLDQAPYCTKLSTGCMFSYHFSQYGLMSSSYVKDVRGCVCTCQYESAIDSGLIFASGASNFHSFVLGISITPSMMAWTTCTPFGPNSRAKDCDRALMANLPVAKLENNAPPLRAAVAEVKINVGGLLGEAFSVSSRSGRTALEK